MYVSTSALLSCYERVFSTKKIAYFMISEYWTFGLQNLFVRTREPFFSNLRTFGLKNLRTHEPSNLRTFGLIGCNRIMLLQPQWRIQGVFWLPGNPPPQAMILLFRGRHRYWHRPPPATYICDFWKPPLRPTLDTPLKQLCIFHCFNNITINDNARDRIPKIFIWSKFKSF